MPLSSYLTKRKTRVLDAVASTGLVAILRTDRPMHMREIADALIEGGCPLFELTLTIPGAYEIIRDLRASNDAILVGAGTVLDAAAARLAIDAGADYIVSPVFNAEVVALCKRCGVAVYPGGFTPTEILTAWEAGADAVKLFSARIGSPEYVRELKGPLPQVEFSISGAVNLGNAGEYIKAGALVVGVGGEILDLAAVEAKRFDVICNNARAFIREIADARAS